MTLPKRLPSEQAQFISSKPRPRRPFPRPPIDARGVSSLGLSFRTAPRSKNFRERRHTGRRTPQHTTNPATDKGPPPQDYAQQPARSLAHDRPHHQTRNSHACRAKPKLAPRTGWMHYISIDTRLGVATTLASEVAAMCVQLADASGNLAIHMPTRILLRSSSTHEPSDPPLEVVCKQASAIPTQAAALTAYTRSTARQRRLRKRKRMGGVLRVKRLLFFLARHTPASSTINTPEHHRAAAAPRRPVQKQHPQGTRARPASPNAPNSEASTAPCLRRSLISAAASKTATQHFRPRSLTPATRRPRATHSCTRRSQAEAPPPTLTMHHRAHHHHHQLQQGQQQQAPPTRTAASQAPPKQAAAAAATTRKANAAPTSAASQPHSPATPTPNQSRAPRPA